MSSIEDRLRRLEDREAITQLKARYCNLNDGGWAGPTHDHVEELMELFTADAVWDGGPAAGRAEGHAAIRQLFTSFQAVPFVIHNVMNPVIEIDGDNARGHWHAVIAASTPERQALWTLGLYKEVYARMETGWKFKSIIFEPAANTPYELGWGKAQFYTPAQK